MDFVTSDLHLNHARICELAGRPFSSVEEMNDAIINQWNFYVNKNDKVYLLGDAFMGQRSEWPKLRSFLNGRIVLIRGNHDIKNQTLAHKGLESPEQSRIFMLECGFDEVIEELYYVDSTGICYWMNHFPPAGISRIEDERGYSRPPQSQKYDVVLHGHTHQKHRISDVNVIHVGVDAWDFRPIGFNEIRPLLGKKKND